MYRELRLGKGAVHLTPLNSFWFRPSWLTTSLSGHAANGRHLRRRKREHQPYHLLLLTTRRVTSIQRYARRGGGKRRSIPSTVTTSTWTDSEGEDNGSCSDASEDTRPCDTIHNAIVVRSNKRKRTITSLSTTRLNVVAPRKPVQGCETTDVYIPDTVHYDDTLEDVVVMDDDEPNKRKRVRSKAGVRSIIFSARSLTLSSRSGLSFAGLEKAFSRAC